MAPSPKVVILDEPVSALDVSIRAQVMNLLADLQERFDLAYLLISHDLSGVAHLSDRVMVMYLGKVIELAGAESLFTTPAHPYTEALLSAVPPAHPDVESQEIILEGRGAQSDRSLPRGCTFHPALSLRDGPAAPIWPSPTMATWRPATGSPAISIPGQAPGPGCRSPPGETDSLDGIWE